MTRAELLKRLIRMEQSGENMELEIIIRVVRAVPDKRRGANGKRYERMFAKLDSVYSGALGLRDAAHFGHEGDFGELYCTSPGPWRK